MAKRSLVNKRTGKTTADYSGGGPSVLSPDRRSLVNKRTGKTTADYSGGGPSVLSPDRTESKLRERIKNTEGDKASREALQEVTSKTPVRQAPPKQELSPETQALIRQQVPTYQETQTPDGVSYQQNFYVPTQGTYREDTSKETFGKRVDRAFFNQQRLQFEQERDPTLKGAFEATYQGVKGSVLATTQGGSNFFTYVKENPIESVLVATALLTPIPGDEAVAGAGMIKAVRTGFVAVEGARYGASAQKRISESPTPGQTGLEILGETATARFTYKTLSNAPRYAKNTYSVLKNVKYAELGKAFEPLAIRGKAGTLKSKPQKRRMSKAEIRKQSYNAQYNPQIRDTANQYIIKKGAGGKKGRLTLEKDPSGKVKVTLDKRGGNEPLPKGGELTMRLGKEIVYTNKVDIRQAPSSRQRVRSSQATSQARQGPKRFEQAVQERGLYADKFSSNPSKSNMQGVTKRNPYQAEFNQIATQKSTPKILSQSTSQGQSKGKGKVPEPAYRQRQVQKTSDTVTKDLRPKYRLEEAPLTQGQKNYGSFRKGQRERLYERLKAQQDNRPGVDTQTRREFVIENPTQFKNTNFVVTAEEYKQNVDSSMAVALDTSYFQEQAQPTDTDVAQRTKVAQPQEVASFESSDFAPQVITQPSISTSRSSSRGRSPPTPPPPSPPTPKPQEILTTPPSTPRISVPGTPRGPPTKPGIPVPPIPRRPRFPEQKVQGSRLVEVFVRRGGKDRSLGAFGLSQAKNVFLRNIKTTLGASGFLKDKNTGEKLSLRELGFSKRLFTTGKKDKLRIVEKREQRLSTGREVKEIQISKKMKGLFGGKKR